MTMDNHAARKAAVYEAALQLIARASARRYDHPAAGRRQALEKVRCTDIFLKGGDPAGPGRILLCPGKRTHPRPVCRLLHAGRAGERAVAYLQDIAANRMGDYKMIAQALDTPGKCESVPACAGRAAGHHAHAAHTPAGCGGDRPAVSLEYCCTAIFSAVVGGLIRLCFTAECGIQSGLPENLKMLLHRTLQVQQ